jgi:hypothetical protein
MIVLATPLAIIRLARRRSGILESWEVRCLGNKLREVKFHVIVLEHAHAICPLQQIILAECHHRMRRNTQRVDLCMLVR